MTAAFRGLAIRYPTRLLCYRVIGMGVNGVTGDYSRGAGGSGSRMGL